MKKIKKRRFCCRKEIVLGTLTCSEGTELLVERTKSGYKITFENGARCFSTEFVERLLAAWKGRITEC